MMPNAIRQSILITLSILLVAQAPFLPKLLLGLLITVLGVFALSSKKAYRVPKSLNMLIIIIALALIYAQQGTFFGIEAGAAILISFLFAKVLESHTPRDWVVVFNFALFVTASSFLYSTSVWMALVVLLSLFSCLVGLYRLHQLNFNHYQANLVQETQQMGKLLLYAAPFFLILFLFFPRLQPLWQMPIQGSNATTGMSEQMAPGDIANLSQSSALAFRIISNVEALPPKQQLYWRAMVLDRYDGKIWSSDPSNQQAALGSRDDLTPRLSYQYLAADPASKWIMALEYSQPQQGDYYVQQDGAIRVIRHGQNTLLNLIWLGEHLAQPLNPAVLKRNQDYIAQFDPKAQQLAQHLYQQSGYVPQDYIQRVLAWYQAQGFQYSLSPGKLEGDHIDDFLFSQKQGFCEHYASSFVMLMRYVGIPARVVVGYQGGQAAPDGKSWEVRQLDAHAWSEVWLKGRWQRIDPTAAIAPDRIEQGIQERFEQNQSVLRQQQWVWGNRIQIWNDFMAYQWQSKVVGYDQHKQRNWLSPLGLSTPLRLILAAVCAIVLLVVGIWLWRYIGLALKQPKYQRYIQAFEQSLAQPEQRRAAESYAAWFERLSSHLEGELAEFLIDLAEYDRQYRYAATHNEKTHPQLKNMLKKCSIELNARYKSLS